MGFGKTNKMTKRGAKTVICLQNMHKETKKTIIVTSN